METSLSWLKKSLKELTAELVEENQIIKKKKIKEKQENGEPLTDISIYHEIEHKAKYLDLYNTTQVMI